MGGVLLGDWFAISPTATLLDATVDANTHLGDNNESGDATHNLVIITIKIIAIDTSPIASTAALFPISSTSHTLSLNH